MTTSFDLQYRELPSEFYQDVTASSELDYALTVANPDLAAALGLPDSWLQSCEALTVLSGQQTVAGQTPLAMGYAAHQFGQWSGLLGDGRASLVGDVRAPDGLRYELHLKGSGRTPYSRRGDGKATLGSTLREYIVSEAMHAYGIPTTRSLAIVTTGETVVRDGPEPGAILCRTARSHLRVGTFQLAAASEDLDKLKALADFAIERLYPDAPEAGAERYLHLLAEATRSQAKLVANWMGVGFIHGVMNTDNALISGETVDYGPCAFMDNFDPAKVFSSIDRRGRYAWNRQPEIANWNLTRLAESLLPLLGDTEEEQLLAAENAVGTFSAAFLPAFNQVMARKLGLPVNVLNETKFMAETFSVMAETAVDFTLFFRHLTRIAAGEGDETLLALFSDERVGDTWLKTWQEVSGTEPGEINSHLEDMKAANPIIIPRNHQVEAAIQAANAGDMDIFRKLVAAVTDPYSDHPGHAIYEAVPRPEEVIQETFCGT